MERMTRKTITLAVLVLFATASLQAVQLTWTEDTGGPSAYSLTSVTISGGDVYVSGYDQTAGNAGKVWKKSSGVWTDMAVGAGLWLDDVAATSSANVWASGNGRIDHYDGTDWMKWAQGDEYTAIDSFDSLNAIAVSVGGSRKITSDGGSNWTSLPAGMAGENRGVIMNAADDIWIGTGVSWVPYVEHWDGSAYTTYTVPLPLGTGTKVTDLAAGNGELYAVGYNQAASRLIDGAFVELNHPWGNYQPNRAAAVDPVTGNLYVCGDRGFIYSYDVSQDVWEEQLYISIGGESFNGIAIEGSTIYAVGTPGIGVWTATIPEPVEPPCESPFTADFNCDFIVDLEDFVIMAGAWLQIDPDVY